MAANLCADGIEVADYCCRELGLLVSLVLVWWFGGWTYIEILPPVGSCPLEEAVCAAICADGHLCFGRQLGFPY